jgi:hypothetical protein
MGFKRGVLVGMGIGYVLGAKAGRQRYEQIRQSWSQLTGSPTVQRATERTKEIAGQQARATVHAVQGQVEKAGSAVKDRLTKGGDDPMNGEVGN